MIFKVLLVLALASSALARSAKIVGGTEAAAGEIKFQVSIQDKNNNHVCGGVIVNANSVMTVASCTNGFSASEGRVLAGTLDTTGPGATGSEHKIRTVVQHPDFGIDANGAPYNDIAMLHLSSPIPMNEFSGGAFVPAQGYEVPEGTMCTTSGWGWTAYPNGNNSAVLLKVDVPIISKDACNAAYAPFGVPANEICAMAAGGGMDACIDDEGGPLFASGVVYGLVSWGAGCGSDVYPGVYTEVAAFRDWIDANLALE